MLKIDVEIILKIILNNIISILICWKLIILKIILLGNWAEKTGNFGKNNIKNNIKKRNIDTGLAKINDIKNNMPKTGGNMDAKKVTASFTISSEAAEKLGNVKNKSKYIDGLILGHSESNMEKDIREIKEMLFRMSQCRPSLQPKEKTMAQGHNKKPDSLEKQRADAKAILGDKFGF